MTYAPQDLTDVLTYMNAKGAPWASLGCIAGPSDKAGGGYHCGKDWLHLLGRAPQDPGSDYSYTESTRDRAGITDAASAIDFAGAGWWRGLTLALVAGCQRNDWRLRDVREIIYTPDGNVVKRWDRLGIRSSGDSSHLWHTHVSFFRDAEGRRNASDNFLAFAREYFDGPPKPPVPPADKPTGENMLIAKDPTNGNLYLCNGITSRPVAASHLQDLLYLSQQGMMSLGSGTPGVEWDPSGKIRLGWNEAAFGAVPKDASTTVSLTSQQLQELAGDLAAESNPDAVETALANVLRRVGLQVGPTSQQLTTDAHK